MVTGAYGSGDGANVDPTLTPAQAAARLGTSVATLKAWREAGRGPIFVQFPDQVRYRPVDLHAWAAQFAGS